MSAFTPRIVGFACNWCTYAGADLAGTARVKYPPELRLIRVLCSGRVDPDLILTAFQDGADGVFVGGCHFGDCHYQSGNYKTLKRVVLVRNLLSGFGIEPERLHLEWVSASEGRKFAEAVAGFTDRVRALGPLRLSDSAR